MISDTLFDAAAEIRDYLERMPEVYAEVLPEVESVLAAMDALRIRLDMPPPLSRPPPPVIILLDGPDPMATAAKLLANFEALPEEERGKHEADIAYLRRYSPIKKS